MEDSFGFRLKTLRESRGMSQDDVAERIGSSKQVISRYETSRRQPKITVVAEIAKAFNVPLSYFDEDSTDYLYNHPSILPITTKRVPLLGSIACGQPIYAKEDLECYVEVDRDIKCDFALRAVGDSMIGAGIKDGYVVFIKKQDDVRDGEIAAVVIDDEATLKRVRRFPNGMAMLIADNPEYPPIALGGDDETRNVHIMGKAVAFQGYL